jgi:hypothetical protein
MKEQIMQCVIGNGQNDRHCATKNYTENLILSNTNPSENWE